MSTSAQRHDRAVREMENSALTLLRYAELFKDSIANTADRRSRSEEILEAARRYARAVRRLARLRV
jgi:hypothetical protein